MRKSIPVGLMVALLGGCAAGQGDERSGDDATPNGGSAGEAATPAPQMPVFEDFGAGDPVRTEDRGCDKVDFLYVIDNSPSMVDEQENLARSFVGFSRIVGETLRANDHQIMIVDTDGLPAEEAAFDDPSLYGCQGVLGAGQRFGGSGDCSVENPLAYLVAGQENTAESFSCLARVGSLGSAESKPIEALLRATGAVGRELETCNTGFMRDDAILVVTVITDDDDSEGQPEDWKQMLLNAKNGNEQAIVMLGLISDTHLPRALPGGPCDETSGLDAPRLQSFAESFELGSVASVCSPDYSEFFAEAVQTIDTACDVFVPIVR